MKKAVVNGVIAVAVMFARAHSSHAQSLQGLHIGEDKSALAKLGVPETIEKYKSYVVQKWTLASGNALSATVNSEGKIVYLESDWNGSADATGSDLDGLRFGATSLADLRRRFGSNGFRFKGRGGVLRTSDGVVMINSYDTSTAVVTFFTKVPSGASQSSNSTPVAARAKLDALSIADADYAKSEWGERIYDPNYKKPEWK
jgi:hypothetical protein